MDNQPWILLDCDGVLLDWDHGIIYHAQAYMPHLFNAERYNNQHWFLWDRFGISKQESLELIKSFHTSDEYEFLQALPEAKEAIAHLSEKFPLAIITACGTDPITHHLRSNNLINAFGNVFEKIICTASSADKTRYLSEFPPSYWVEDRGDNAHMGVFYAHECFLVDATYNQTYAHTNVTRINNLKDLVELINNNPML